MDGLLMWGMAIGAPDPMAAPGGPLAAAGERVSYAANGIIATDKHAWTARGVIMPYNRDWMRWPEATADAYVTRPADTIMIAEKHGVDVAKAHWAGANVSGLPLNIIGSSSRAEVSGMDMIGNNCAAAPNGARMADGPYCLGKNGAVSARHADMVNFAFADGHVKAMKPTATNPDGVNKPELNLWGARRCAGRQERRPP